MPDLAVRRARLQYIRALDIITRHRAGMHGINESVWCDRDNYHVSWYEFCNLVSVVIPATDPHIR